jgi:hypothetical protein
VLLGLRTAPKEDSGVSVAELVYGAALALPAEFLSAAEPPATKYLPRLQQVEIQATRPLSYAEVAAAGGAATGRPRLRAPRRHIAVPSAAVRGPV